MAPSLKKSSVLTPSGPLELLSSIPEGPTSSPPLLCLHGAFCSAHDYQNFLPYFASHGYPAYAVSTRGHGASWKLSWVRTNVLTTTDDVVSDISDALRHVREEYPAAPPPVLIAHSLGGAHVQHLLSLKGQASANKAQNLTGAIGGLVLLASASLSGGGQITRNWYAAMPSAGLLPWSERPLPDTPKKVRGVFFQEATPEETVEAWIRTCRTAEEGIRVAVDMLRPYGESVDILSALDGIGADESSRRKVLCVAADRDHLTPPAMVAKNADAYAEALESSDGEQVIMRTVIPDSGHHLMMDIGWEVAASRTLDWLNGRDVAP